jgi:hypothetical protein
MAAACYAAALIRAGGLEMRQLVDVWHPDLPPIQVFRLPEGPGASNQIGTCERGKRL